MSIKYNYLPAKSGITGIFLLLHPIKLYCEKTISVNSSDELLPDGSMFIYSPPSEANIFMNSKNRRRISLDIIKWLVTEDYKFSLIRIFQKD